MRHSTHSSVSPGRRPADGLGFLDRRLADLRSNRRGDQRSQEPRSWQRFRLGAFLGIIGIIIVACQKPGLPPAPAGLRAVKCTRCSAVQNIHKGQTQFECWQCKTVIPAPLPFASPQSTAPQSPKPKPAAAKPAPVKPKSAASSNPKPPPGVLAVGAAVKIIAAEDEHQGQIGVVHEIADADEDGLDVLVTFKGRHRGVRVRVQPR